MKDLTGTDLTTLRGKIKSFLDISWEDTDTDNELDDFIITSINWLDDVAGAELDYLYAPTSNENDDPTPTPTDNLYHKMCYIGQNLLKNRVFYLREKALDDFDKNYQSSLVGLFNLGKIYKSKVSENAE